MRSGALLSVLAVVALLTTTRSHGQPSFPSPPLSPSPICSQIPPEPLLPTPPSGPYSGSTPELYLWPANGPRDMAPGATRSTGAGFGPGLDRGALRRRADGVWEYLEFGPSWTPWHPSNRPHLVAASAFRRYGPGWSYGPSWGGHTEHWSYAEELCGRMLRPDEMGALDLEHSNSLYRRLQAEWMARFNPGPVVATPIPTPLPVPMPAPTPTPLPVPTPIPTPPTPPTAPLDCPSLALARASAWSPLLDAIRTSSLGRQVLREVTPELLQHVFEGECRAQAQRGVR
jgi:hypothetical protein